MSTLVNPTANHASRIFEGHTVIKGKLTARNIFTENEWQSYTPTLISGGTLPSSATVRARWRLIGRTLNVNYSFSDSAATGGASTGAYVMSLPTGVVLVAAQQSTNIGSAHGSEAATPINFTGSALASGTTSPGFTLLIGNEATSPVTWGNSAPAPVRLSTATGKTMFANISVEIDSTSPILLGQNT